jgi:hypothetical protein
MHTLKVILGGIALLLLCLAAGRWLGGAGGLVTGAKLFIPLWLLGAGLNLWLGVTRAGYTVAEELPVFGIVFAVPVLLAVVCWWLAARASW